MALEVRVTDPAEVDHIHSLIHDNFFEPENVVFDSDSRTLVFPFERDAMEEVNLGCLWVFTRRPKIPVKVCLLKVHNVRDYTIRDTERIGKYDFNVIEYNAKEKVVEIMTNFPIGISIKVEAFEISVECWDKQ